MGGIKTISIIVAANIKGLEASLGKANKSVAGFASNAARLGSTLTFGVTAPLTALGKSAFDTFSEFENSMTKVMTVTGATAEEFKMLTDSAKQLGATTQFTAREVANLQLILGRKGFDPRAIEGMQDAILDLALATGEDLGLAANVVSASINAFSLEADDAAGVANTLASAAANSSIELNTFATAFGHAGASAQAVGVDIEELSSMMGVLMDNGIKASKAGTGLRKIFMRLNEAGIPFSSTLEAMADGTMSLNEAQDLVGVTAANQLLILSDNLDKVKELTEEYKTNTTRLQEMANVMGDTTQAKVAKMTSAIEGLKIELGAVIADAIMPMIEGFTKLVGKFGNLDTSTQKAIVYIGGFLAVIGPLVLAFSLMVAALGTIGTGLAALGTIIAGSLAAWGLYGSGVIALTALLAKLGLDISNVEDKMKELEGQKRSMANDPNFMLTTWAEHQALEAQAKAMQDLIDAQKEREKQFRKEQSLNKKIGLDTIGAAPLETSTGGVIMKQLGGLESVQDKLQEYSNTWTGLATDVTVAFSDAFSQMLLDGNLTLRNLTDLFKELGKVMLTMVIRALALTALFRALGMPIAGGKFEGLGMSGFKQALTAVAGGEYANGGRPPLGKVSLVGERGPELFVPDSAGTVIPNHALGGGGTVIPDVRISGDDLLIVFDRATRRKNRR